MSSNQIIKSVSLFLIGAAVVSAALTPSGPIVVTAKSDVVIENVKITSATGDCVVLTNATNITIRASEIGPCNGNAIKVSGGSNINILDSYIHPEGTLGGCCDKTDGIYASGVTGLTVQGNVIAYGEANIEVQRSSSILVKGNFLLNPRNGGNRGQQFQCYDKCSGVIVDSNYTISSKNTSLYSYAAAQEDAINIIGGPTGYTTNSTVKNNYVVGGFSGSGCGVISDSGVSGIQILNNTLVDTGQCGIGIASGSSVTVSGNRVRNTTPIAGGGNTGLYIWNQYSTPCGPVSVSGNTITAVNTAGADNSYWNGGGCGTVTLSSNTFGGAALSALTPISTVAPPPLIPPAPYACVVPSPFTTQSSMPRCGSGQDTTPPSISIVTPTAGQTLAGAVTLSASASDNVGVVGVQFLLNGTAIGAEVTAAPYNLTWSSTTVSNGSYTIAAQARDAAGNRATSAAIAVAVNNVVTPPASVLLPPVSDDFHSTSLNATLWSFQNPVGNGSYSMTGTNLLLIAPAGSRHDPSDGGVNNSVRMVQQVSDVDFTVETAFNSVPSSAYQMEGILVQQDTRNYIRFETSSNGSSKHVSASTIVNGAVTTRIDTVVTITGSSVWLRVQRASGTWKLLWSSDGVVFNQAGSFTQAYAVSAIGPYAGNWAAVASATPAFTASVDYFFNTASPIVAEDGVDTAAPTVTVLNPSTGQVLSGTVSVSASASDNVGVAGVQFLLNGTAIGAELTTAPYTLSWPCNAVANGSYNLTALARDAAGNRTTSSAIAVTVNNPLPAPVNTVVVPVSDDFHATALNSTLWSFLNPAGGTYTMNGTNLLLTAPGGARHDPSDGGVNNSVRVIQKISDTDFSVEAAFNSLPTAAYQMEGILVQQDARNFIRFEVSSNGSAKHVSASTILNGVMTARIDNIITVTGSSVWIRVQRAGTSWKLLWSGDGSVYTQAGTFTQACTVSAVGPYSGNYGAVAANTPAFTASVDYFFNTASPIAAEDGITR